ncbi:leucine-rich repeat protein, putative [Plasmodium ovale]|uniref:Leucine-rich repeat protein, putative n=1 Tax=Plasmodium ovale TaxID=36330 RepID=A0A1D3U8V8_PLAOA|nr:leucine-rich repeat protein, putative [Plasmodium ovale]
MGEENKKLMTYEGIKKICADNNLYETDELNEVLYLHMKGFHNIDGLSTFTNLKCLFLNNNCIKKIDNLGGFSRLKALYLQNNDITTIENIECSSLVILNLSNNKIKTVTNLRHLKLLQTLNLSSNLIEDLEDIREVAHLESLTHLDLSNNNLTFDNEDNIQNLHEQVRKLIDTCSGDKSNFSEEKCNQIKICTDKNEVDQKFLEIWNFYKNFNTEIKKKEENFLIMHYQNIDEMDFLTKKKIFFLFQFIILLKNVKRLKTLFIKNNPFAKKIRHAPKYIVANIPTIAFLDDKKVKKEDVCLARIFLKRGAKEESELKKIFEKKKEDKYKNTTEKFHAFLLTKSGSEEAEKAQLQESVQA